MTGRNFITETDLINNKNDWIANISDNQFFIYGFITKVYDIDFDYDFLNDESSQVCYEWGRQYGCYLKSVNAPVYFKKIPKKLSAAYKNYLYSALSKNYISCYVRS